MSTHAGAQATIRMEGKHLMTSTKRLKVSENGRYLIDEDGAPWFYLGDTAWELFHRLNREEADYYLETRAAQGFTAIQAVVLAEFDGLRMPNAQGDVPLENSDPTRPVEAYFAHVDYIVNKAQSLGLFVAMLPTWGDKWNQAQPNDYAGPEIFTPENAHVYGEFLGNRYSDKPIIWVLGGDRSVDNDRHRAITRSMARGLARGDNGAHLMTWHPRGGESSSINWHQDDWLSFNMLQSGHCGRDIPNDALVSTDYHLMPAKPCLDGEPCYEDHPVMTPQWGATPGAWFDSHDVRKAAYRALFSGAHGHTYGCHDIWQMWDENRAAVNCVRTPWREAIHLPGANQMRHARALMQSRPFLSRVPDNSIIVSQDAPGIESKARQTLATRDENGSYALIYAASGEAFTVDMSAIKADKARACWFDPRNGTTTPLHEYSCSGVQAFQPPSSGPDCDWILILDDAARNFPLPAL